MTKNALVSLFETHPTPTNAERLVLLVKSFGGQFNAISGLTKLLFEKAKSLLNKKNKLTILLVMYQRESTPINAQKIVKLVDESPSTHIDFGIPNEQYADIKAKANVEAEKITQSV